VSLNSHFRELLTSILISSTDVAREIIDVLIDTGNHELILLSRKKPSTLPSLQDAVWTRTDYTDVNVLIDILAGVDTVLSFITSATDHENKAQKALIDASVRVGVRRFAPSEWGG
jgi:putative NADH-flavin reductase